MSSDDKRRPPMTNEEVEAENIYLTNVLANAQLKDGSASSQTMKHFLDLGSSKAAAQAEKLKNENLLLEAKIAEAQSSQKMEALLKEAIDALTGYQYRPPEIQ